MTLVITTTLLVTFALLTLVVYRQNVAAMEDEMKQEADYICKAIEIAGTGYLDEMDEVRRSTRVTWIDRDGKVLYDSGDGQDEMGKSCKPS